MIDTIRERVRATLPPMTPEGERFWDTLLMVAPDSHDTIGILSRLGVRSSTLTSRFRRQGLLSPSDYLTAVRFCLAAWMFDRTPMPSVSTVAYQLNFASSQSFTRHMRRERGWTGSEFAVTRSAETELAWFTGVILAPTAPHWAGFNPVTGIGRCTTPRFVDHRCPECGAPKLVAA